MLTQKAPQVQPHDADPSHYLWGSVPLPVLHSNLSPVEKVVYTAYFAATRIHKLRFRSVSQVARDLKMSRSTVKAAMKTLEERGFIRREYRRTPDGIEVVRVTLLIPGEIEGAEGWLQATPEGPEEEKSPGREPATPGREPATPGREPATIENGKEEKKKRRGEPERCGGAAPSPGDPEDEEVDLDAGSKAAAGRIERDREERAARKRERTARPGAARPAASGEEFRETPSARPEWGEWRDKDPGRWAARDLVGLWVSRFREVRGAEDPDFCLPSAASPYAVRAMRCCKEFVRQHLEGSNHRFRDAVERILAGAEGAGKPVALLYFFTPSNPRTLAALDRPRAGGRAPTPAEVNDAWGADREHWDRKAEDLLERRKRKAAKLGVPLSQVRLHVGEEVE